MKATKGWLRGWLPWHAMEGMGLHWRTQDLRDMSPQDVRRNALMLLVIAMVFATCAAALAVPRLSLLIDLAGGLVVATIVLFLTGQWQELRRGLRETGAWPEPGVQCEMMRQYILGVLVQTQKRRRERRATERIAQYRAEREEATGECEHDGYREHARN